MENEIKLKLTIDGKEAVTTINLAGDGLKEIDNTITKISEHAKGSLQTAANNINANVPVHINMPVQQAEDITPARELVDILKEQGLSLNVVDQGFKKVAAALQEYGNEEQYIRNMGGDFDGVNVTVGELIERLSDLKQRFQDAPVGSDIYNSTITQIKEVQTQLTNLKSQLTETDQTPAFQNLTAEALKYNSVNKENITQIQEYILTQNLSSETIKNVINALDKQTAELPINSEAWQQNIAASTNLRAAYSGVINQGTALDSTHKAMLPNVRSLKFGMEQFGYTLGMGTMTMGDWRMAMHAATMNMPMFMRLLREAKEEAAATGTTVSTQLMAAITGGGGLIIGINAALLVINLLTKALSDDSEEAANTKISIDILIASNDRLTETYKNLKSEINNLSFDKLIEDYDGAIKKIDEINKKLSETSTWGKIWQGLTFKPLTSALGYTMPWQDMANDWGYGDDKEQLKNLETSKDLMESTGNKIKYFINNGYTVKDLLYMTPKEREDIKKNLDNILFNWPEEVKTKEVGLGDKLNKTFFSIGTYQRDEVDKLKKTIEQIDSKKNNNGQVTNEVKETEQLKGKLEEIKILKNTALSQYEKEQQILESNRKTAIEAADSQIASINKKPKLDDSDKTKIENLNNQKLEAQARYEQKSTELATKHEQDLIKQDMDYKLSSMQLEGKSDSEILRTKQEFYKKLYDIENDPEKKKELFNQLALINQEANNKEVQEALQYDSARINAMKDGYEKQKALILQQYAEQKELHRNNDELLKQDEIKKNNELEELERRHNDEIFNIKQELAKVEIENNQDNYEKGKESLEQEKEAELHQLDDLYAKGKLKYLDYLIWKYNITKKYADAEDQIDKEKQQAIFDRLNETLSFVQNAFSQFYQNAQESVRADVDNWKKGEEDKIDAERKTALSHATSSKQREKINEEYDKKKDALDKEAKKKEYDRLSSWFEVQKALAIANIAVQMAQAIAKGYGELGPIGGAIAMGITIAALTAQAAAVAAQKMPGYNLGGKLIPGKPGVFEGNQVEIVAPEKTFLDVMQNEYMPQLLKSAAITMNLMSVKDQIKSGLTTHYVSSENREFNKLGSAIDKLNKHLDNGITATTYYDDKTAKHIVLKGNSQIKKSKFK